MELSALYGRLRGRLLVLAGLCLAAASIASAQQASIVGRVTDQTTGRPVSDARVMVVGTNVAVGTNAEGRYALRGVPVGSIEIRALRVGYTEQKKQHVVRAGATDTVDFSMTEAVITLQSVVTTATGDQRKVELGNTVSSLDAAKIVEESPVKSMGDLLVAKAPGVQVLDGNMTGSGSRVRIRGTSSLSLSNDPIYIIDGIRMTSNSNSTAIGVGGTAPSRVNDINPDEIENIEIVKGPSAATLYGTDASNGVIVITTKHGRAGAPRWSVYAEGGDVQDKNAYPVQYNIWGHTPAAPATVVRCRLPSLSTGACLKDSSTAYSVLNDPLTTPLKDGPQSKLGVQVSGGTESLRYFVSIERQDETGPLALPAFDRARFDSTQVSITPWMNRPEALTGQSFRTNLSVAVNPKLDISVNAGFTNLDQRLPQVDNNINSFWFNAETGPGTRTGVGSLGQQLMGYSSFTPGDIFQQLTTQDIQRFIGSTSVSWRPFNWLEVHGDLGTDLTDRVDLNLCEFDTCNDFSTQRLGFALDARTNIRNITSNLIATGTWRPMDILNLKTTVGAQYVSFRQDQNLAEGDELAPGATTPTGGAIPFVSEATTVRKTLGVFIDEQAAIHDRLFLNAALRTDQNSAFGQDFQRVYYPKFSASYIISDEGFFPRMSWLNQLRLRASFGASGVQPGPTDALRTFTAVTTNIAGTDVGGLRSSALGNVNLRPERATEFETGFDTRMFSNRINIEITYYNKLSKDAIIAQTIAPDAGSSSSTTFANLGAVQNTGVEAQINAQVIDRRWLGWDVTLAASHNGNKLVTLGLDGGGHPIPPIITSTLRQVPGYPVNGYWNRTYTAVDANHDGIITPNEVTVGNFGFLGYSQPRDEVSLANGFDLFNKHIRINMLADYKGGYSLLNSEQQFLCANTTTCKGTSSPDASLYEQGRAVAEASVPVTTQAGYFEPIRFWRIRELSVTYSFGEAFAQRYLHARGANINVGVRNLKVWTNYTGVDPEANYGQVDTQQTLLTAGPQRFYTARFSLNY